MHSVADGEDCKPERHQLVNCQKLRRRLWNHADAILYPLDDETALVKTVCVTENADRTT